MANGRSVQASQHDDPRTVISTRTDRARLIRFRCIILLLLAAGKKRANICFSTHSYFFSLVDDPDLFHSRIFHAPPLPRRFNVWTYFFIVYPPFPPSPSFPPLNVEFPFLRYTFLFFTVLLGFHSIVLPITRSIETANLSICLFYLLNFHTRH